MKGIKMQELWDLYDKNRRPLNITHVRGDPMKKGTYHVAVGIWTVNDRHEILVTLRSRKKSDWPNLWENTAGSVLSGETSRHGAVRELYEETGIKVSEDELYFLGSELGKITIGDCYMVRKNVDIRDIVFQDGETCDAKWVTLRGLEDMIKNKTVAPPCCVPLQTDKKKV